MAAMEATGIRLTYGATGGGSDANIILSKGIPIASLAIGFQQNHTLEEWIALDDLTKSAELMLQIAHLRLLPKSSQRQGATRHRVSRVDHSVIALHRD